MVQIHVGIHFRDPRWCDCCFVTMSIWLCYPHKNLCLRGIPFRENLFHETMVSLWCHPREKLYCMAHRFTKIYSIEYFNMLMMSSSQDWLLTSSSRILATEIIFVNLYFKMRPFSVRVHHVCYWTHQFLLKLQFLAKKFYSFFFYLTN